MKLTKINELLNSTSSNQTPNEAEIWKMLEEERSSKIKISNTLAMMSSEVDRLKKELAKEISQGEQRRRELIAHNESQQGMGSPDSGDR